MQQKVTVIALVGGLGGVFQPFQMGSIVEAEFAAARLLEFVETALPEAT